ncbi:sigma-54-dependent transcriptional regulator [Thalassospira tepidiphila]|uniref:Two-component system C4-dicarboxylate transport response regulator DctD n=1 Tax=Thalassospira tepidiphila TaxID=393657 RepID=A0ABX0WUL8_9PROT|nr:sigma-54 dependent transcriptional regulator [Thalassospira tepidiphila]NJB73017.1 two-component system C4-dicarboxylate transport response regulator DctD [Thalassospira tepidiphila]
MTTTKQVPHSDAEIQITPHIIIVDDDEAMRISLAQWLELSDFDVTVYEDARQALHDISPDFAGVILTDVKMPKLDGITFTRSVLAADPDIPIILMTGHGDVPMAVEAMKSGAYDFVEKPFEPKDIVESLERAIEKRRLVLENRNLRRQIANRGSLESRLIGNSMPMRNLKDEIANIAPTEVPVLISGETGTGKELVARAIHDLSDRRDEKFVAVNCAAIPESTAESELFGHEKGAFTGAASQRIGWIEHAIGGTLFLDEISSMPLALQAKLLRVIEQREVVRLGSNAPVKVDFRLICATNEDLVAAVAERNFREDLLFRINTFELSIAPLRERQDDVALLFDIFAERAAERFERPYERLSPTLIAQLRAHEWPGNVRELKNMAERYVLLVGSPEERFKRLFKGGFETTTAPTGDLALADQVREFEERIIRDALDRHDGNVKSVMEELDIPRRTLNEKMKKLNIRRDKPA